MSLLRDTVAAKTLAPMSSSPLVSQPLAPASLLLPCLLAPSSTNHCRMAATFSRDCEASLSDGTTSRAAAGESLQLPVIMCGQACYPSGCSHADHPILAT